MKFTLSPERRQFAAVLHDLLESGSVEAARAWAAGDPAPGRTLWKRLAGVGVTELAVDADPVDLVIACEEAGHHAVPGPVVESLAVVPTLLAALGDKQGWLPALAAGDLLATVAMPPLVPLAVEADLVLHVDGDTLSLGVPGSWDRSVDRTRRLSTVVAGEALVSGPAVRAAAAKASDTGVLACAAQLLGAGRALLDLSVTYAGQRVQFGAPIGRFQAVKHQLADVAIGLEFARPLLYGAAVTGTPRDVSAAKVACGDAAYRAARTALQVHGAIGYTEEYPLSLWLTKVRALVSAWGTPADHRARVAASL